MTKNTKKSTKKAELTSGQIVSIIILILSFIIILLLWRVYYWNPIIDQESCHESVVYRSTVNFGIIKSSKVVPLKCQTEKTCMTMGGKDCLQVGKTSKENLVTKVTLDKDPEKAKQQIIDQLTEEMYTCHSMLGEGKLQFFPESWFEKLDHTNYCLICSRIVLDDEARQKVSDITYSELYMALSRKVTPDKTTYLEYLYPDWKDWHGVNQLFYTFQQIPGSPFVNMDLKDWKMNLSDEGGLAIIAQESTKDYWKVAAGSAAVLTGTALVASGVGAPAGVSLLGASAAGGAAFWYNSPTGNYNYSSPTVYPYNLGQLQNMQCDSFETAP
jgi:hypothetical protein